MPRLQTLVDRIQLEFPPGGQYFMTTPQKKNRPEGVLLNSSFQKLFFWGRGSFHKLPLLEVHVRDKPSKRTPKIEENEGGKHSRVTYVPNRSTAPGQGNVRPTSVLVLRGGARGGFVKVLGVSN